MLPPVWDLFDDLVHITNCYMIRIAVVGRRVVHPIRIIGSSESSCKDLQRRVQWVPVRHVYRTSYANTFPLQAIFPLLNYVSSWDTLIVCPVNFVGPIVLGIFYSRLHELGQTFFAIFGEMCET